MMVSLSYSSTMPQEAPPACLIVGEQANLQRIGFSDVETLISHRVSAKVGEEVFKYRVSQKSLYKGSGLLLGL